MNKFSVKKIISILVLCYCCSNTVLGMQSTTTPLATSQPSTMKLLGYLGLGVGESLATALLTNLAVTKIVTPAESFFSEHFFPGAGYAVPLGLAATSYLLEKIAEHKEQLSRIRTGTPSQLWSRVKTWCSSARGLILQGTITQALGSYVSTLYQHIGSNTATVCNALAPQNPGACSWVADKTATSVITTLPFAAMHLAEKLLPADTPELRVRKGSLMAISPATKSSADEPVSVKTTHGVAMHIAGPQIHYFLTSYGCNLEKLWHRKLSQIAQIKASKNGNWQKLCIQQLAHLCTNITSAFNAAVKKLPTEATKISDLLDSYMPFGQYPQQFTIDTKYREHEQPSFSRTVVKNPQAIFSGIRDAVLSYFDPNNLQIRSTKGDEAIFNCPITPVFIKKIDESNFTITAYPQSRQDLLYPCQWESPVKLPRWFHVASKVIPYAILLQQIIRTKSSAYFAQDGVMCTTHDNSMTCSDGSIFSTTCTSHASCAHELSQKRLTQAIALRLLELNPRTPHTLKDIKEQYHTLAKRYHPDTCKEKQCDETFLRIAKAYDYLKNKLTNIKKAPEQQHTKDLEVEPLALSDK